MKPLILASIFALSVLAQEPGPYSAQPAPVSPVPKPAVPQPFDAQTQANLNAWLQQQLKALASTPSTPVAAPSPVPVAPVTPAPIVPVPSTPTLPTFPANFVFLGAAYAPDAVGVPNYNAVGSYGKRLTSGGGYSFTSYDVYFIRGANKQIQLMRAERTGYIQWIRSFGPVMLFAVIDGGLSQTTTSSVTTSPTAAPSVTTNTNVGGSFSGGGFGALPIGSKGFALVAGARIVASTIAPPGNKTVTVIELAGTFSWGQ